MSTTTPGRLIDPDACRHCGIPQRSHYQQWTEVTGWHKYVAPTDGQRLHRMQARRAARLAAKQPPRPAPPECHVTITAVDTATPLFRDLVEQIDFLLWGNELKGEPHA